MDQPAQPLARTLDQCVERLAVAATVGMQNRLNHHRRIRHNGTVRHGTPLDVARPQPNESKSLNTRKQRERNSGSFSVLSVSSCSKCAQKNKKSRNTGTTMRAPGASIVQVETRKHSMTHQRAIIPSCAAMSTFGDRRGRPESAAKNEV
jgi:hypothetical protein